MGFEVSREFEQMVLDIFIPGSGWQWIHVKDDTMPYTAYTYYRLVGTGNFKRIRDTFCMESMFSSINVKDPKK